jgi:hypothetical protein
VGCEGSLLETDFKSWIVHTVFLVVTNVSMLHGNITFVAVLSCLIWYYAVLVVALEEADLRAINKYNLVCIGSTKLHPGFLGYVLDHI